ncbi:putative baseplate assembly protein [Leptolyngbya sp. 'hensonii']|uniref:putative baseplate assembly protein n=1 Tax=Leptolyngbya sp. 'hensonii' TaxID=1922337 RepID=UPI00094F6B1F|nr:putative baseplate assembly protein [Leptolyngbya sp. 'hensonii']OLP20172.1 putative baseplate assembly protein [Leptolyngbya sp. 'hensonii']
MEFQFLPQLPKSDLDDRKRQDLVDECILRIPRYCPEWTNYSPSDPGITLVELFAWMTEQMLTRFNQVPRRNYIAFLELLGMRLRPPTPAQTDLTFYLNTVLPEPYTIPEGVEVATIRTEGEDSVIFSLDRPLVVGQPQLRHFLTAEAAEALPRQLRDRLTDRWTQQPDGRWEGSEQLLFDEQPQVGNCFYLVMEPGETLEGNVLAISVQGEAATATGINPNLPPRYWEAWDGANWQPILRQEADDATQGFSFSDLAQGRGGIQGGDVILHLPQQWPISVFQTYQGRWLRCVYVQPDAEQPGYSRSPRIVSLAVRAIGGTAPASQCTLIREEVLGLSNGTSGQTFQLFGVPVLPRRAGETIQVMPPDGLPQTWQEVPDFADSGPNDRHYVIDSVTGTVQFGPLIREPGQLQLQTQVRAQIQAGLLQERDEETVIPTPREQQYGAVPPRGAVIRMLAYRTGGGQRGNVQRDALKILKTAIPYIASVVNHAPARNGADAETLEQLAIRVPRQLRTRNRAVTPEDFETLALQAGQGSILRARCLPAISGQDAGIVQLLLLPQINLETIAWSEGLHPDQLILTAPLQQQVLTFLEERKLLGVRIQLQQPDYVGVSVRAEVGISPEYNNPQARQLIWQQLQTALYRFLNPIVGGPEGTGWPFGRQVYTSDIIVLFQKVPGVRYLEFVQLTELRRQGMDWIRSPLPDSSINPGANGLICSWNGPQSGHTISLIQ